MRCTLPRANRRWRLQPEERKMTEKRSNSEIPGDAEVAGAFRKRRIGLPMRSDFFPNPPRIAELLTPAASGCTAGRPLTKSEDQDTIIINRSARSTYPTRKSVRRSGATPVQCRHKSSHPRCNQVSGRNTGTCLISIRRARPSAETVLMLMAAPLDDCKSWPLWPR